MNVFDVHVNRSPFTGIVSDKNYVKGKFINASLDKANKHNERLALVLDTDLSVAPKIGFVQIAGLVARRILCDVDVGDRLSSGQTYGLIRFGSRVDVWLPAAVEAQVRAGQKSIAGETVLARLPQATGSALNERQKDDTIQVRLASRKTKKTQVSQRIPELAASEYVDYCGAYFWFDWIAFRP